jgi:hypothetical protein
LPPDRTVNPLHPLEESMRMAHVPANRPGDDERQSHDTQADHTLILVSRTPGPRAAVVPTFTSIPPLPLERDGIPTGDDLLRGRRDEFRRRGCRHRFQIELWRTRHACGHERVTDAIASPHRDASRRSYRLIGKLVRSTSASIALSSGCLHVSSPSSSRERLGWKRGRPVLR